MLRNIALLFLILYSCFIHAQGTDTLTNDTIIKMVQAGVPAATIIRTIAGAEHVNFHFLPGDLELLQRANVPDDVFKAMATKDKGAPIPSAPPAAQTAVAAAWVPLPLTHVELRRYSLGVVPLCELLQSHSIAAECCPPVGSSHTLRCRMRLSRATQAKGTRCACRTIRRSAANRSYNLLTWSPPSMPE